MERPIYLDFNATTPIAPEVAEAMLPYLYEHFGNPSSTHPYGAAAKRAVEHARTQVAALIGARPEEIVFTSGGSESNNSAIMGVARALRSRGRHVITSAVEHPSVLEPCRALAGEGCRLTIVPVDSRGRVSPDAVLRAITPETVLVTVMHANNEVGTLQPIAEIAEIARSRGALLHTDAAQSVGKIPVDVRALGVDLLSIAGHKLYAPKGIGALYIRSGREIARFIHGAAHESNRRAGTENVMAIVGLGRACEIAARDLERIGPRARELRDRLWERLAASIPGLHRNGDPEHGLPNTLSVGFPGVEADRLLAEVGDRVAASAGAACHAEDVELSSVLVAMQVPFEIAKGTVRFSVGRTTTADEVDAAAEIVIAAARRLARDSGAEAAAPVAGDAIRLTKYTAGMGCACKLRPQALEQVLRALPVVRDPAVLVDASTADDAAVYRISDHVAIVQTVDFFTPIADDPYEFGAISASNSLSDLYAMGATPRFALSVVGFPTDRLPLAVLGRILEGAADKCREAGVEILGGHTVEDAEPKFGLAATGTVDPRRILTNASARAGDVLVLTKPLGTGIVMTALKRGLLDAEAARPAIETMLALNRSAAEAMLEVGAHACTDVTGFGLLGHLREMTAASHLEAEVAASQVPVLAAAREMAAAGVAPGGSQANLSYVAPHVEWGDGIGRAVKLLLADAQTSGGLLIAVGPDRVDELVRLLRDRGVTAAVAIGRLTGPGQGRIRVSS